MNPTKPSHPSFPLRKARLHFFGSVIDRLTMTETLQQVAEIVENRKPKQHVVVNVAKLVMMQKDEPLRDLVNSCDMINCDGQGIVMGARWLGFDIPERVTGIDLFQNLMPMAQRKGWRIYFLGARQEVVEKVVAHFTERYPDLQVAGYRNGYFLPEEEPGVVDAIRESKADLLFVAMTSPKKELFLNQYLTQMNVPFAMGVGGSFDVIAGVTKRAPVWMQKNGMEWLYRLFCEPGRMWRRYLVSNTIFLGMLLKAFVRGKHRYAAYEESHGSRRSTAQLHENRSAHAGISGQ